MPRSTPASTALECADVSHQIALRGVLPWLLCGVVAWTTLRGSLTWDTGALVALATAGGQFLSRRAASAPPEEDTDDR